MLVWAAEAGSTNVELIRLAGQDNLPDFTVYATANQVAGKGRAGRVWEAPADSALAISVLLRPNGASANLVPNLGWLPLLGGLAMSLTVADLLESQTVGVKWPNDVLVDDRKITGVLTELVTVAGQIAVVLGAGINVSQSQEQLPIANATSLQIEGAVLPATLDERLDAVLAAYLTHLSHWYQRFVAADFDPAVSGLLDAVSQNCLTIGRPVRAILPGDAELLGTAVGLDATGRLILDAAGTRHTISAGDIVHLRH